MRKVFLVTIVVFLLIPCVAMDLDADSDNSVFMIYDTLLDDEKEAYDRLYETVINGEPRCDFENLYERTSRVYYAVAFDHPELLMFYIDYGFWWYTDGHSYIEIQSDVKNPMTPAERSEQMREIESVASSLKFEGTAYEKVKQIHDYLATTITYEWYDHNQTMYGALVDHRCVCAGYSQAFNYLCRINGIDCIVLRYQAPNPSDSHLWNAVRLDGKWYQVDVTMDDIGEGVFYEWFLTGLNEEFLSTHHGIECDFGLDYSETDYPDESLSDLAIMYFSESSLDQKVMDGVYLQYIFDLGFLFDSESLSKLISGLKACNAHNLVLSVKYLGEVELQYGILGTAYDIRVSFDDEDIDFKELGIEKNIDFTNIFGEHLSLYDQDGHIIPGAEFGGSGIYAFCVERPYHVILSSDGDGRAIADTYEAMPGTEIMLTAIPEPGCKLSYWESSDVEVVDGHFTMPEKDVNITAIFCKEKEDSMMPWIIIAIVVIAAILVVALFLVRRNH